MKRARVDRALCICTTLEEFEAVHALATTHDNFWSTVGVSRQRRRSEPSFDDLVQRAALPRSSASARPGWTTFAWATYGG
jgi:TatD DNase family protein